MPKKLRFYESKLNESKELLALLKMLVREYPGLIDGYTPVNGADLVETLTSAIADNDLLSNLLETIQYE